MKDKFINWFIKTRLFQKCKTREEIELYLIEKIPIIMRMTYCYLMYKEKQMKTELDNERYSIPFCDNDKDNEYCLNKIMFDKGYELDKNKESLLKLLNISNTNIYNTFMLEHIFDIRDMILGKITLDDLYEKFVRIYQ